MFKIKLSRLAAVAILAFPGVLSAQSLRERLALAEQRGWYVRVTLLSDVVQQGKARATDSAFIIGGSRIQDDSIATLDRRLRYGGAWKTGALVGGASGAALGVMAGNFVDHLVCFEDCQPRATLTAALICAVSGALLGGVVGRVIAPPKTSWTRIWPPEPAR